MSSITLGCQSYTQAEAIAIMLNPTRRDRTYQLAAQLAAAKLNVDCNLTDRAVSLVPSRPLILAMLASDRQQRHGNSQAWKEITATYNTLADYNNGLLCAAPR